MKTKNIRQSITIKASPKDVYEAFMDSKEHSMITRARAKISKHIGGHFSAFEGWAQGEIIDLIPDKRIVLTWHADDDGWPKDHYSKITITLHKIKEGTRLTFFQSKIPMTDYKDIKEGWHEHYWNPMKAILEV